MVWTSGHWLQHQGSGHPSTAMILAMRNPMHVLRLKFAGDTLYNCSHAMMQYLCGPHPSLRGRTSL